MFSKLTPRNDEWNRKYNFTDENSTGFLMDMKNGLAYFGWIFSETDTRFYKCEESVFNKHFSITSEVFEFEIDPYDNITFLRYPID